MTRWGPPGTKAGPAYDPEWPGASDDLPLFDEPAPGVLPAGFVAGGPVVLPAGFVAGVLLGVVPAGVVAGATGAADDLPLFDEPAPGVLPAGFVAGGPGVFPAGFVAGLPPLPFEDEPPEPALLPAPEVGLSVLVVVLAGVAGLAVELDPGFETEAQNAWTVSPSACASAVNRVKAVDERAFPRVVVPDAPESDARYAVHSPYKLAVAVAAAAAPVVPPRPVVVVTVPDGPACPSGP